MSSTEKQPKSSLLPSDAEIRADPLKLLDLAESEEEAYWLFAHVPQLFWAYFLDLELEPFHTEFILAAEQYPRLLGEWPAGHGKSTNMSYGYPIWHVARNPNVRIIQIGKTTEEMDAYALQERNTLEKNERLNAWYGPFRDPDPSMRRLQPWSANGINVCRREISDPHNTIEWFGSNSDAALGHRCDMVIIDDVVTPDTAGTPERRSKLLYRFREQWQTAPQYRFKISKAPASKFPVRDPLTHKFSGYLQVPKGIFWPEGIEYQKIIVVGTVFHYQDLYHTLEKDKTFKHIRKDCFVEGEEGIESLWPSRWSLENREREKISQGTLSFNRRYRNLCLSEDDLAFREEDLVRCLDGARRVGDFKESWRTILSLDPASGNASRFSAYPAFTLWGYDPKDKQRKRYLIDLTCQRDMGYHAMLDRAVSYHDRYHYDIFVIENNAFGSWLMDKDEPAIMELKSRGVRIIGHHTDGKKKDPEWGVRSIEPFFRDGLYSIPYAEDRDKSLVDPWLEQFRMFPQGYQDLAMSTWFADLQIRKGGHFSGPVKPGGGKFYTMVGINRGRLEPEKPGTAPGSDTTS